MSRQCIAASVFVIMLALAGDSLGAGVISGKVMDAASKPVVGVKLSLFHQRPQCQPKGEQIATVESDASGAYSFETMLKFDTPQGTDWSDHYIVVASDSSHAPGWSVWTGTDLPATGDITLEPVAMQPVLVRTPDDEPLANATVQIIAAGETFDRRPAFRQPVTFSPSFGVAAETTNVAGEATIHLPRSRQTLLITCPGYADQEISLTGALQKETITCRMVKAGTLTGVVSGPDCKPLADAWVCISNTRDRRPIYAKTDADGRYTCDRLAPRAGGMTNIGKMRDYSIYLVDVRFCSATVDENVEEGQTKTVDLNAETGTLVRVKVVETESNHAVAGAYIGGVLGGHMIEGFTNELGVIEFRAPSGEGLMYLRSPPGGFCHAGDIAQQRFLVEGDEKEVTIEIPKFEPLVNIHGKLTDATGKPLPSIEVMIACRDSLRYPISRANFITGTISGSDGGFVVKGFPAGRHLSLYATTRNRKSAAIAEWDVPEAGGDLKEPIKLAETVSCDVDFSAAVGSDASNQRVMVAPIVGGASFNYVRPITIDAAGHLKMGGVIPGVTYRVEGESSGPMIQNAIKKDIELVPN